MRGIAALPEEKHHVGALRGREAQTHLQGRAGIEARAIAAR